LLGLFPATQGVASVVGLIALAEASGERIEGESEPVTWRGRSVATAAGRPTAEVERMALIPHYRFTRRIS